MNIFELDIFEPTSGYSEFRLSTGGGTPKTRDLEEAAVDHLIEIVERDYSQHAAAQEVFDSPQLRDLGTKLSTFLDGSERWLTPDLDHPPGTTLRITAGKRLRHLPWELLTSHGSYLTVSGQAPLLPVRAIGTNTAFKAPVALGNRPLRVLFMAASPEGVEPVLNYEAEEAAILAATSRTGTELVVEGSGTLEGLRFLSRDYGEGYFDVLHLSGHTTISKDGQPTFLAEDKLGGRADVTAAHIAEAMFGRWPRLVFVSGCLTGNAPDGGTFPSMSESLVRAGAPAVLGWALPVGDVSATGFAAELYRGLADGTPLDRAIVEARQHLYVQKSSSWHLLRVYADKSPLAPMVTPLNTRGRARIQVRAADQEFLDPQTQLSRVAARGAFVGRRRVIQRCLHTLKQPLGRTGAAEALVLHDMGGLDKSSLASRLLERMPTHQRAVWYGRVDLTKFRELATKVVFPTVEQQIEAANLLANDQAPLAVRLRHLLHVDGLLGQTPCLFVFDGFEDGNLEERDGGHVLSSEMAGILPALLNAIRDTGSLSRVIITSRYRFPTPAATTVVVESLETLTTRAVMADRDRDRGRDRDRDRDHRPRSVASQGKVFAEPAEDAGPAPGRKSRLRSIMVASVIALGVIAAGSGIVWRQMNDHSVDSKKAFGLPGPLSTSSGPSSSPASTPSPSAKHSATTPAPPRKQTSPPSSATTAPAGVVLSGRYQFYNPATKLCLGERLASTSNGGVNYAYTEESCDKARTLTITGEPGRYRLTDNVQNGCVAPDPRYLGQDGDGVLPVDCNPSSAATVEWNLAGSTTVKMIIRADPTQCLSAKTVSKPGTASGVAYLRMYGCGADGLAALQQWTPRKVQ